MRREVTVRIPNEKFLNPAFDEECLVALLIENGIPVAFEVNGRVFVETGTLIRVNNDYQQEVAFRWVSED